MSISFNCRESNVTMSRNERRKECRGLKAFWLANCIRNNDFHVNTCLLREKKVIESKETVQ